MRRKKDVYMYNRENPGAYNLIDKILMRIWPTAFVKSVAWRKGCSPSLIRYGDLLFEGASVGIVPTKTGGRGFRIILNNKLCLYFYQDGKHFKYDGWEVGEYEDGDITVFDYQRIKAACDNMGRPNK